MSGDKRTFNILDTAGNAYTLTVLKPIHSTGYLYNISGLGMETAYDYQKIGESYEIVEKKNKQGKITGTIFFHGDYCDQEYAKFTRFCQNKSLTISYRTPAGEYRRDGHISKISKDEKGGALKVDVEFTCVSLWYRELSLSESGTRITLDSDSAVDSPCHLMFKPGSAITSLTWSQTVNGTSVMTGGLTSISVSTSQTLHIRTDTNPYKIYRNTESTNYYRNSNFSTKRFPLIQKGTNVITFGSSGTITLEVKLLYETV